MRHISGGVCNFRIAIVGSGFLFYLLPRVVNKTLRRQEVSLERAVKRAKTPLKTAGIDLPDLVVKLPTCR